MNVILYDYNSEKIQYNLNSYNLIIHNDKKKPQYTILKCVLHHLPTSGDYLVFYNRYFISFQ